MLTAALELQAAQQQLAEEAATQAQVAARRGARFALAAINRFQYDAINASIDALAAILLEQELEPDPVAVVRPEALLTSGVGATDLLSSTDTNAEFERLVRTLVADAGRSAMSVAAAAEPSVTGYVRVVSPRCCGRCAVLAGRFYRWSTGFRRHPRCDCQMVPSTQAKTRDADLTTDPDALFRAGQIRGLSRADTRALNLGADLGRVVNVRVKRAGLSVGGSVLERSGRLTPAGIFRIAGNDRDRAIELLRRNNYLAAA